MIPKLIMVPFSGKDSELGALETAAELAKKYHGHIDVWHIVPSTQDILQSLAVSSGMGAGYVPVDYIKRIEKENRASRTLARKKYQRFLRIMQIAERETLKTPPGPTATFHVAEGLAHYIVGLQARLADIVVLSRAYKEGNIDAKAVISNVIFDSGRPALLVPAGKHSQGLGDNAVIAWNASLQATHAVTAALPLLAGGKAQVISAVEKASDRFQLSPHELALYLGYHGVKAKPVLVKQKPKDAGPYLLTTARKAQAKLIVMGAYTHNRARQWLLGGVTQYMLEKATIPVLFAH